MEKRYLAGSRGKKPIGDLYIGKIKQIVHTYIHQVRGYANVTLGFLRVLRSMERAPLSVMSYTKENVTPVGSGGTCDAGRAIAESIVAFAACKDNVTVPATVAEC